MNLFSINLYMEDIYYQKYLKYKNKYMSLKNKNTQVGGGLITSKVINVPTLLQLGGADKKEVFLFKAEWCPHCTGFLDSWEKLQKNYGEKYEFVTYDSEKNQKEIKEWHVEGFPTIIVKKGNDAREYIGPNNYDNVLNFIENNL